MRRLVQFLLKFQVVRFLGVGGVATLIYYAVFIPLLDGMHVQYILASVAAFFPSFAFNFWYQKKWAFRSADPDAMYRQFVLFALKNILFFAANTLFLYLLVEYGDLLPLRAQILITIGLTVASFFVSRRIFTD